MKWLKTIPVLIALALLGALLFSSAYTVQENQVAVVQTFGRYTKMAEAGLHFKFPWPVQSVKLVDAKRTHKMEIGYYQDEQGNFHDSTDDDDQILITGDMNVIDIDFFMEYKISDPVTYLFVADRPEIILKNMLMSSARSIIGSSSIDEALTTGKFKIQGEIKELLTQKLKENDIGLAITDLKINDSEPPTEEVNAAFRDVETAKQKRDTTINNANQYKNSRLPAARGEADRILKEAEAKAKARENEAKGLKERYETMYEAFKHFQTISKERMYLEAMRDILPQVELVLDTEGGIQKYMPLAGGPVRQNQAVEPSVLENTPPKSSEETSPRR